MRSDSTSLPSSTPVAEAGLSLGSNMGDRLENLAKTRDLIAGGGDVDVVASSPIYETEPVGVKKKYRDLAFLNAVLIIESRLGPEELSTWIHAVEDALGRKRSDDRYAPRPIDVDILYFGNVNMESRDLTLPHPSWYGRRFVVQPLADVRPELILPGQPLTCTQVLSSLPEVPEVVLFQKEW